MKGEDAFRSRIMEAGQEGKTETGQKLAVFTGRVDSTSSSKDLGK